MNLLPTFVVLAVFASAFTSAGKLEKKRLEELLMRLLDEQTVEKKDVCDDKDCGTGQCGGGENPHGFDEAYYCFDCNGPNNDLLNGGLHCELPDPCGSSPCSGAKPVCKTTSMIAEGYYCRSSKRSFMDELLDHLEDDADQEEYVQIRQMIAQADSPAEGLAKYARSFLE